MLLENGRRGSNWIRVRLGGQQLFFFLVAAAAERQDRKRETRIEKKTFFDKENQFFLPTESFFMYNPSMKKYFLITVES